MPQRFASWNAHAGAWKHFSNREGGGMLQVYLTVVIAEAKLDRR